MNLSTAIDLQADLLRSEEERSRMPRTSAIHNRFPDRKQPEPQYFVAFECAGLGGRELVRLEELARKHHVVFRVGVDTTRDEARAMQGYFDR